VSNIERIGDLLIRKGLLNHSQLTQALEFQAKLSEDHYMPIGEILISFGFIRRNTLNEILIEQNNLRKPPPPPPPPPKTAMPGPPPPPPINRVSMPNQSSAQAQERAKHKPIGEILIEKGFIDRSTISKALQYQAVLPPTHHKPIGEILIELGNITREQLDHALGIQPPVKPNLLGEILKQLGIIDDSMLAMVLSLQHSSSGKPVPVGELLVQHGFISRAQLDQGLEEQRRRQ
jgi:hypothetical protein